MKKFQAKQSRVSSGVRSKSSINQLLKSIKRFQSFHTANIFQHHYQSYCDYFLRRMDEEKTAFGQLTFSDFKKWSSTALKAHYQIWDNF